MNRQIKFRGKPIDKQYGEWVHGYYLQDLCDGSINHYIFSCPTMIEVDPDTIGQFTGLLDKNDKEIYEGDILSVCNGSINCCPWMDKPYPVEYQLNKGFIIPMFLWDKDGSDLSDSTHYCEAIGNIHDNSDLME